MNVCIRNHVYKNFIAEYYIEDIMRDFSKYLNSARKRERRNKGKEIKEDMDDNCPS